jgi:gamma-glutamyltranspeptidase/glutathione hydrolase
MNNYLLLLLAISLFTFNSCRQQTTVIPYQSTKVAQSDKGMVVTAHPLATKVGLDVLKQGGNAVDAAVATQFALAVVWPRAGNLGGGGFMVLRMKDGKAATLDFREKAPLTAHRDMYLDSTGQVIEGISNYGHLAVGVPGSVAGLVEAHQQYGNLPLETLLSPAIKLAEEGFPISLHQAQKFNNYMEVFRKYNSGNNAFTAKETWQGGDLLVQTELAATLQAVRDQGRAGFYKGKVAQLIVDEIQKGGGIISLKDLEAYQPAWREPIIQDFEEYRIISMPPPSSGGIALLQMLEMLEPYPLEEWGFHSALSTHYTVEAMRRAFADRAEYLGDPDFYEVPVSTLLDSIYLRDRMSNVAKYVASISDFTKAGMIPESPETTHTSIVDAQGNAVSLTTTLNSSYGSKVIVDGAGFFLNDEMDDFSAKPGVPNQFGLLGNEANAIQAEKRMLSSMTPTIVEKEGELFLVVGSPGGAKIITSVFQVVLNTIVFDQPLDKALPATRFHHQWYPDSLYAEEGAFSEEVLDSLRKMGYAPTKYGSTKGRVKGIQVLPEGVLLGVGDSRNPDDHAEGL